MSQAPKKSNNHSAGNTQETEPESHTIKGKLGKNKLIKLFLYAIGLVITLNIVFIGEYSNHPDPHYSFWLLCSLFILFEVVFCLYWYTISANSKKKILTIFLAFFIVTFIVFVFIIDVSEPKPPESLTEQFELFNKRFEEYFIPDINSEKKDSGLNVFLVIKFNPQFHNRRKYIFDIAQTEFKNRASLFIDPNDILVFELIDSAGEVYNVKIPEYDFRYNEFVIFQCEYGINIDFSYIRIFINGKLIKQNKFSFAISLPQNIKQHFSFGCDITGKNCGNFAVKEQIRRRVTAGKTDRILIQNYLNKKYSVF